MQYYQVNKVENGVIIIDRGINKILLIGNNKEIKIGLKFSIFPDLFETREKMNNKHGNNK